LVPRFTRKSDFRFMKMSFQTVALLFSILFLNSACYNCVECTGCTDPANDQEEVCYDEAREYYGSRREWREDVQRYEDVNGCNCR